MKQKRIASIRDTIRKNVCSGTLPPHAHSGLEIYTQTYKIPSLAASKSLWEFYSEGRASTGPADKSEQCGPSRHCNEPTPRSEKIESFPLLYITSHHAQVGTNIRKEHCHVASVWTTPTQQFSHTVGKYIKTIQLNALSPALTDATNNWRVCFSQPLSHNLE